MSDREKPRTKIETYVSCMSCGQTSKAFVLESKSYEGVPASTTRCPRCSCTAYVSNLGGLWAFMAEASKQIAALKLDVMDLQGALDDQHKD